MLRGEARFKTGDDVDTADVTDKDEIWILVPGYPGYGVGTLGGLARVLADGSAGA